MKKITSILACLVISITVFGQKDVVTAYNLNKEGKYMAASEAIDRATTIEKASAKEKTWRYRGDIYLNIARDSSLFVQKPTAIETAIESYKKAMELDSRGSYHAEDQAGLQNAQILANNYGAGYYQAQEFKKAANMFDLSTVVAGAFDRIDTLGIFNTALCFEKAGMMDQAIEKYLRCGELNYQVPNVYLFIANMQGQAGDDNAALETLREARKTYPREQSLIIEELNIYIKRGEFDLAKQNLELAAEQDPTNELLWFSLGTVSDNLNKLEDAEAAYLKAIEIKPEYFDANYNLGAMYFNQGVQKIKLANEIPPKENAKYNAMVEKANADFEKALPYLERAFELDGEDQSTIKSLRDIYARTGNDEGLLKMSKLLEGK